MKKGLLITILLLAGCSIINKNNVPSKPPVNNTLDKEQIIQLN